MQIWCVNCEYVDRHFEFCFVDWNCTKYKNGCNIVLDTCKIALEKEKALKGN